VRAHERSDPEFAAQLKEAEDEGAQLLHAVCWKAVIEGNVEPIYWQGQIVGEVRRYDSRLRIEMLRAHMPDKFKTLGSGAPRVAGDNNQVVICDSAEREKLIAARPEALEAMNSKQIEAASFEAPSVDSGNSPGSVQ
jgi:hypothetical protein